jgi:hypothetical protein
VWPDDGARLLGRFVEGAPQGLGEGREAFTYVAAPDFDEAIGVAEHPCARQNPPVAGGTAGGDAGA